MANITTTNVIINVSIYFSATNWAIITATVWEFPKRENGWTHDRYKGLFCALANWPLPCKDRYYADINIIDHHFLIGLTDVLCPSLLNHCLK